MNKHNIPYILASLLVVAVGLLSFIILWQSPYTGLTYGSKKPGHYYIYSIDKNGPAGIYRGLEGAEVVRIGDINLTGIEIVNPNNHGRLTNKEFLQFIEAHKYFFSYIKLGKEIEIQVINKNGERSTLLIKPTIHPIYAIVKDVGTLYMAALFFIIIATLLIRKENKDPRAKLFFIFSLLYATTCIAMSTGSYVEPGFNYYYFLFLIGLNGISLWIGMAAILHFALIFPKANIFGKNTIFVISIYIIAILITIIATMRIYFDAYFIFMLIYSILVVTSITYNFFTASSITEKTQIKWIIWGILSSLIIGNALFFIPLIITGKPIIAENPLLLIGILIPISMAFAISKYKLMDIDNLFDNTIIYSIIIFFFILIDFSIAYLLTISKIVALNETLASIISIWIVIFAYIPVRNKVSYLVKKLLKREIYDIHKISLELSEALVSINNEKNVIDTALKYIDNALHPKDKLACLYNDKGNIDLLNKELYISPEDLPANIFLSEKEEGAIILPLQTINNKLGYFILYPKHSNKLYDKNDQELLRIIANLSASTIERIRYREERYLEEQARIEEKERLSREIHDGIGNTFAHALALTRQMEKANEVDNLQQVLNEGLTTLRDLIWTVDNEEYPLSSLTEYLEDKVNRLSSYGNNNIITNTSITINDIKNPNVCQNLRIHLIRIVQESITNILKYAEATEVYFTITYEDNLFQMEIRDNGKGFQMDNDKGHGIRNMQTRAEKIGGDFNIYSKEGEGTRISIKVRI